MPRNYKPMSRKTQLQPRNGGLMVSLGEQAESLKRYYEKCKPIHADEELGITVDGQIEARRIKRNRLKCLLCGDIVQSTHRHDMVYCKCGKCAIDGGNDYVRVLGEEGNYELLTEEAK